MQLVLEDVVQPRCKANVAGNTGRQCVTRISEETKEPGERKEGYLFG
jgi:hypothetical protein